ncbi:SIR2 family protein [Pseudarthrobacter sp. NPDC057230]|uniref:SIR2 family protein n=1 Tax=Pseudarthrobacter sp. NPDC057230 TaxID=3346057 RepID=UPI0036268CF5
MHPEERLKQALNTQQLVIVAGTGVTMSLSGGESTSDWLGLIKDGISHVQNRNSEDAALLSLRLERATTDDLISIAQDLQRHLGEDFARWIAHSVGDLPLKEQAVAHGLGKLGVPILTTNYDDLLEKALGRASATWHQPGEMRRVIRMESSAIGHLHGIWKDIESVVFSQSSYQSITENADAQNVQKSAFDLKTFLFVGVGDGLSDPNFSPMVSQFAARFPSSPNTHFRLCLNSQVDPASALKSVVDVGYGDTYADLAAFLERLGASSKAPHVDLCAKSRVLLVDRLRDNSTLWRDEETLHEKSMKELVVPPIFLPEPHDQYVTNRVIKSEKDKPIPIDLRETLHEGGIVLIAGEESSGVSTALTYCLNEALDQRHGMHALIVDEPLAAGPRPVKRVIDRTYGQWGVSSADVKPRESMALGIDNLRYDTSTRFDRAVADIVEAPAALKLIGVRQSDAVNLANILREKTEKEVKVVFLGRFSNSEALEIARRIAPGREEKVADYVMIVIREKNLPRTPLTVTLLVDLVQSGVQLQKQESEIAVLDQYLDMLLSADFGRTHPSMGMTLRNKRLVLETLARKFVEEREDKAPRSKIQEWLEAQFEELGWDYDVSRCIDDLVRRRVLTRFVDNTIGFQRSAYLELMAGLAARDDEDFRRMVFSSPLQLASIVRTYAAMTRNDKSVLELVENEIARISITPLGGNVFASVRRIDAQKELFGDRGETEAEGAHGEEPSTETAVEREGIAGSYYDDSDDSDTPAFMTARLEDLSQSRVAMLVVDLALRVLRDSDEVRDQDLKKRILRKLLVAWVSFTDLYEQELSQLPDLDEVVSTFIKDEDADPEKIEGLKNFLTRLLPVLLTDSGIRYCLSGPSLVTRLAELELPEGPHGDHASIIRTLALYASENRKWIGTLKLINDRALKTFFCAAFFAGIARYAYVVDATLSDEDRDEIRSFLRRVIAVRYNFKGVDHRSKVLNDFEASLRRQRLQEGRRRPRAISIA